MVSMNKLLDLMNRYCLDKLDNLILQLRTNQLNMVCKSYVLDQVQNHNHIVDRRLHLVEW